jgi:hypothetical protein
MTTLSISQSNSIGVVVPQQLLFGKRKRSNEFRQEADEIKRSRNFEKGKVKLNSLLKISNLFDKVYEFL